MRKMGILLFHSHEICQLSDKLVVSRFSKRDLWWEWAVKIKIDRNIYCKTIYSPSIISLVVVAKYNPHNTHFCYESVFIIFFFCTGPILQVWVTQNKAG